MSDFEDYKSGKFKFPWGKILKAHKIGEYYQFIEAAGHGLHQFHAFFQGKDLGVCSSSIEGAMILAIAFSSFQENRGTARDMAKAAAKLLDIEEV